MLYTMSPKLLRTVGASRQLLASSDERLCTFDGKVKQKRARGHSIKGSLLARLDQKWL
jgi:hypothetical protein